MNNTLQDLVNTQPGSYFSGSFQAAVSECKSINTKTGKTFFKATLTEGGVEASAMSFTRDLSPLQGKLVKFSGMGIKRGDDFNGKAQVTLGEKSIISPVGESVPPASIIGVGTVSPAIQGRIEGITVGMAINKAVDISIRLEDVGEDSIWQRASMLIRLAQKLQSGNLAPEDVVEDTQEEEPY